MAISKTWQEHNVPMGPGNPQALNWFAYCLNNPLRYVDSTGYFEEDLLKEWFPDHWQLWRDDYPDYWQMLLEAEYGDTVTADFNAYKGMFVESDGSGPPLIVTPEGEFYSLTGWLGAPFRGHNERGEYGWYYSYQLTRDVEGQAKSEVFDFGNHSTRWQCDGPRCNVRTRHLGWEYALTWKTFSEAAGLDDFIGIAVAPAAAQLAKKLGYAPLGKAIGWSVAAVDVALFIGDACTRDVVVEERWVWIDWSASKYKWE